MNTSTSEQIIKALDKYINVNHLIEHPRYDLLRETLINFIEDGDDLDYMENSEKWIAVDSAIQQILNTKFCIRAIQKLCEETIKKLNLCTEFHLENIVNEICSHIQMSRVSAIPVHYDVSKEEYYQNRVCKFKIEFL